MGILVRQLWNGESKMSRFTVVFSPINLSCAGLICASLCCVAIPASAQSGAKNGEWRTYGADLGNTRYSPLNQITAANFNSLEVAWHFKTDSLGPRPEYQ